MSLLVTRPEPDASATVARLRARGCAAIISPVMAAESLVTAPPSGAFDAVLISSANAARAVANAAWKNPLLSLPVIVPGAHSAAAAQDAGFVDVRVAGGDAAAMVAFATRFPHSARLLYLAGEDRAVDLAAALMATGQRVDTLVVYRMARATALDARAVAALAQGAVTGVMHYSARSADAFVALARAAGLAEAALALPQLCISTKASEPLAGAGASAIFIAARPDEDAMLDLAQTFGHQNRL